ncbi:hypothetical protein AVEN_194627-1 [Araneus ventricosus]|uniref:Uncharacterized protein n=1 Tax=Araneus ventricosus TaxID=182803 RepID=A0A4Y2A7B6_ARAVE|nr:hypothetical protein AVEN_194627-1 [Araneus ventricosus]
MIKASSSFSGALQRLSCSPYGVLSAKTTTLNSGLIHGRFEALDVAVVMIQHILQLKYYVLSCSWNVFTTLLCLLCTIPYKIYLKNLALRLVEGTES